MRGNFFRLSMLSVALLTATTTLASGITEILEVWSRPQCYNAEVEYTIWLPQRDEPVKYTVKLSQRPPAGDPDIMPCDYLVEWRFQDSPTPSAGFSAYTDGHHYRFNGHGRLNEYRIDTDSAAFNATRPSASVQRSAQFVSLLPAAAALELDEMLNDTTWRTSINANILTAEMRHNGEVVNRRRYTLGPDSLPLSLLIENNIGAISEQSIEVIYTARGEECDTINEETLTNRFPEQFAHYRRSNYNITSLAGQPLPQLALLTPTGERYLHCRGDRFRRPTVIALLDAEAEDAKQTVEALRRAVTQSTVHPDLILAVVQPDIDTTEQLLGALKPGEHHLMGARTWLSDIGATMLPTIIVCNDAGVVTKIITEQNKDVSPIVIEALMNQ